MEQNTESYEITTTARLASLFGEVGEASFKIDGEKYDRELPARQRATLY